MRDTTPSHDTMQNLESRGMHHVLVVTLIISLIASSATGLVAGLVGAYFSTQILAVAGITPPQGSVNTNETIVTRTQDDATIDVVKKASPSVVSIIIKKDLSQLYSRTGPNPLPFDDFFEFGFPFNYTYTPPAANSEKDRKPVEKQRIGGGSGFIISSDGLILTNRHVVADEDAEYVVVANDGKESIAKVLALDPLNDLAIIKIEGKDLTPLVLGNSDEVQIGQTSIAIGNTLGEYKNTITKGVISGVNRVVEASDTSGSTEVIQEAIQTDTAINPGNSGGPLLNLAGQVIGINTAVNRAGQSIGFAIPINTAKRSVESVKKYGRIIRPWLGIRYVMVDEELQKKNNLSVAYGALIQGNQARKELGVIAGSPAEKAGLVEGDIILEINNQKIDEGHALANEISKYDPNTSVGIKVLSHGETKNITVILGEFNEELVKK